MTDGRRSPLPASVGLTPSDDMTQLTPTRSAGLAMLLLVLVACRSPAPAEAERAPTSASPEPIRPPTVRDRIVRAAEWMSAFPAEELRFDAMIGLSRIAAVIDAEQVRRALDRARREVDVDDDHPHRRIWDPQHRADRAQVASWTPPRAGEPRINPNRPISEALHCAEHGIRPETLEYIGGAMRDEGGYHSTHAAFALAFARDNGCLDPEQSARLTEELARELRAYQPEPFEPATTLDIDLYGERVLMLLLLGDRAPPVDRWLERLAELQNDDGSWGRPSADEPPYFRFHATMVAAWTLALSLDVRSR